MKKLFLALSLIVAMASCSPEGEEKQINPNATEFTSGKLAEYVAITEAPVTLRYTDLIDESGNWYMSMLVPVEVKKDRLKGIDMELIDFEDPETVLSINLTDNAGNVVTTLPLDYNSYQDLIVMLTFDDIDFYELHFAKQIDVKKAKELFGATTQFAPGAASDIKPVKAGFKVETDFDSASYGYEYLEEKVAITLMDDGSATVVATWRDGRNFTKKGTWTTGMHDRGNNSYVFYDIQVHGGYQGRFSFEYYVNEKFDYVFTDYWEFLEFNTKPSSTYKVTNVSDVYLQDL